MFNFGERFKDARECSGFTQAEISKLLGVSVATISGYELGRIVPSVEVLVKFARATNSSADDLLGLGSERKKTASGAGSQLAAIEGRLSKRDLVLLVALARAMTKA